VIADGGAAVELHGFVWEWEWELPLLIALLAVEGGYFAVRAWSARRGRERDRSRSALAYFTAGILVVAFAVVSPIGANDERLLSMHMLEHDLLMWVAAPLMVLGVMPLLAKADWMPALARRSVILVTRPATAVTIATVFVWAWHAPSAYGLALTNDAAHAVEHLCYLVAYFIYWWPLIAAPSVIGGLRSNAARAGYLIAGSLQSGLLAALLAFADEPWYPHYLHVPGATAASALADQGLAGALMLYPGAIVFLFAAVLTIRTRERER